MLIASFLMLNFLKLINSSSHHELNSGTNIAGEKQQEMQQKGGGQILLKGNIIIETKTNRLLILLFQKEYLKAFNQMC